MNPIERRPLAWTVAITFALAVVLSLLPLPAAVQPFPLLRSAPGTTLSAVFFPGDGRPPVQPPPPVLEEEDEMVMPELDLTGQASHLSPEDEREGRRWDSLARRVGANDVQVEDPCLDENPQQRCTRTALTPFFEALKTRSEQGKPTRVVVLGTSLIASDHITDVLRRRLEARHHSAGPGYLFVDRPTRGAGRTVRSGDASAGWVITKVTDDPPPREVGFAGVSFTSPANQSQQTSYTLAPGVRQVELFLLAQPGGGQIQLLTDGVLLTQAPTQAEARTTMFASLKLPEKVKTLTIRTSGGPVRLDGVSLETGGAGVVLDSLGMPGASAGVLLREDEDYFASQLLRRDPSLVVLMMGGNEAFDISLGRYTALEARQRFQKLIHRVKAAVPRAACLLASPCDGGVWRMDKSISVRDQTKVVAAFMRELASEEGCGFYDMQQAMGGEGSVERWWKAGLMNQDLIHPIAMGGDLLGYLMDEAIERARTRQLGSVARAQPRRAIRAERRRRTVDDILGHGTRAVRPPTSLGMNGTSPVRLSTSLGMSGASIVRPPTLAGTNAMPPRTRGRDGGPVTLRADGGVLRTSRLLPDGGTASPRVRESDGGTARALHLPDGGLATSRSRDTDGGRSVRLPDGGVSLSRKTPAPSVEEPAPLSAAGNALFSSAPPPMCLPSEGVACRTSSSTPAGGTRPTALNGAMYLEKFFRRLDALESTKKGRVAIAQLGASHTAAQFFTDEMRNVLGSRFGYAGRGFIAAGRASERLENAGARRDLSEGWTVADAMKDRRPNGIWGLTGVRATGQPGADLTVGFDEPRATAADLSRLQIFWWQAPDAGTLQVTLDGTVAARLEALPAGSTPTVGVLELEGPGGGHSVQLVNVGNAPVTVFGVSHELLRPGVVYDALGLPGSTAMTLANYAQLPLAVQLNARQPDLFVLFYGTNESALEPEEVVAQMRASYPQIFTTLRTAAPDAACLFLGPTDRMRAKKGGGWRPSEAISTVDAALRGIAATHGCAFWDTRDAMGGEGTIERWRHTAPPLSHPDHVHLTEHGYQQLADWLNDDLMSAYEKWRRSR
jgi:lysophospholipase L1-like esterase